MTPQDHKPESAEERAPQRAWKSAAPRWILIGLFLYASVFALGAAKNFLVPVVLAFLLAMVFGPIRRLLDRWGLPSGLSALLIVLTLLFGFLSIFAALSVPVSTWAENAPQIERQVERKLSEISRSMSGLFEAKEKVEELANSQAAGNSGKVETVQVEDGGMAASVAMIAPGVMAQFVFTFVLLMFLLASGDMFYEKLVHVMPTLKDKRRAIRIAYNIERKLSRYLLTITAINAGLGLCVGIAMWWLGMPSPVVFGVIAFIANFIPYLGAIAGILITTTVGLLSFDGLGWGMVVGLVYFGLTAIEGQFVTPYFVGRNLQLNTVVVFVTISFWAWLWSAVGMIVALPLLVAVKTFCEHIDSLNSLGDFLSARHAEKEEQGGLEPRET